MGDITERLLQELEARGLRGRIVQARHALDLRREIEGRHADGLFDETFYQERLTWPNFTPPDCLPGARSLIVVASPQPQVRLVFTWQGRKVPLLVPPTYVYKAPQQQAQGALEEVLGPEGYRVAPASLPEKLLAARSGLARYGRNNITYVPGMGSFYSPAAFYSDLPCEEDSWQEPQMLEVCGRCQACLRHCPTGALVEERFLLRAERCLTFHNERAAEFPAWIDSSWHNCLIGCMHCQRVCPENKDQLAWIEAGPEFTGEETALLLEGAPAADLPAGTMTKLEAVDLGEELAILPRNLRAVLAAVAP